jgi:hypothetical protein
LVLQGRDQFLSSCRDLYEIGLNLRVTKGVTGRVASNDNWPLSLHLAYFVDGQYLGKVRPGASEAEIRSELARVRADYYLVWPDRNGVYPAVSFGEEIVGDSIRGLRMYRLHNPSNR